MSGLLALVPLGRALAPGSARVMLAAIAHRGDHEPRLLERDGVALGHVALPTTPEAERELLPASDAGGRYWLTWDGRLDNREELDRSLGLAGGAPDVPTDADYVLAAYARWGDGCVDRLLGDWALVIWDTQRKRLFCAKDPLGWRPLFYRETHDVLAVGSEPLQLFAGSSSAPEPDRDYLLRFLAGAAQPSGSTCYGGVRDLEGGQTLVAHDGIILVRRTWRSRRSRDPGYRRLDEYVDDFEATFRQAVRARLRSNRRVAVALSGGLDSSYIAAIAAEFQPDLAAITLYAPGTEVDEREYARSVAGPLGLQHSEVAAGDCWGFSSRWVPDSAFDDPNVPPPSAITMRLGAAARELDCGVLLGGDGGDEWLDGDDRFVADALLRGRFSHALRLAKAFRPRRPAWRTIAMTTALGVLPLALQDRIPALGRRWQRFPLTPVVDLDPAWLSPSSSRRTLLWQRERSSHVEWDELRRVSRSAVAWRERNALTPQGVDLRTPFHDLRVIELLAGVPHWVKRWHTRDRELLRAAGRRRLPDGPFDRPRKVYFDTLVLEGLDQERARIEAAVNRVCEEPGVRAARARELVDRSLATGMTTAQHPVLRLVTAGLWLHQLDTVRARYGNRAAGIG